MRAIFLDRDGVVNHAPPRGSYITHPEELRLVDGIQEIIRFGNKNSIPVIIATNQGHVARSLITLEALGAIHTRLLQLLSDADVWVNKIYCCIHDDIDNCLNRKPSSGMLFKAEKEFGIDLHESLFIGDSWKDIESGNKAGVRTIFLRNNWNSDDLKRTSPTIVVESLAEVLGILK